jgi:hypothetical protein
MNRRELFHSFLVAPVLLALPWLQKNKPKWFVAGDVANWVIVRNGHHIGNGFGLESLEQAPMISGDTVVFIDQGFPEYPSGVMRRVCV